MNGLGLLSIVAILENFNGGWCLRRSLEQGDQPQPISYDQVFALKETTLATIAKVTGKRWCIEECFKLAKSQLGLADYEVRS